MRNVTLVCIAFLAQTSVSYAQARCGTCMLRDFQSPTWREIARTADVVVVGRVVETREYSGRDKAGATVVQIDATVHTHPLWRKRDRVTIEQLLAIDPGAPPKSFLIFGEFVNGQFEVNSASPISSLPDVTKYLRGSLAIDDADMAKRIAFYLTHLDSEETGIASDAATEFRRLAPRDLVVHGKSLKRGDVLKKLGNPRISPAVRGQLVYTLAGCGQSEDFHLLREMLDRSHAPLAFTAALEPILVAMTTLAPQSGIAEIVKVSRDPKREFLDRYHSLRTLRYFYEHPVEPIDRASIAAAVAAMLDQDDMADLAMEDLRRWHRWEFTGKVLGYYEQKTHQLPIIRRSIIRFALDASADNKAAADFVNHVRLVDSKLVDDLEEVLKEDRKLSSKLPGKD